MGGPLYLGCARSNESCTGVKDAMRLGYASILTAVVIWAGWMVATRFAVNESIAPLDLAMLRYGVPAICLAPWWWQCGILPRQTPLWALAMMMGWGAPFVIFMAMAMETASVAHVAAIVPCMMPLLAAAMSFTIFGERFGLSEKIGFGLIALGAAFIIVPLVLGGDGVALGHIGLLMLCALGWASFSVAFRRSGLTPPQAAGLVCLYSTLVVGALLFWAGSSLTELDWQVIAFHGTAQGLLSGAVATIAFGIAIQTLGPPRAASFSALVPGLAAIIAYLWLGEVPTMLDTVALGFASLGVAFANRAFGPLRAG